MFNDIPANPVKLKIGIVLSNFNKKSVYQGKNRYIRIRGARYLFLLYINFLLLLQYLLYIFTCHEFIFPVFYGR